MWHNKIYVDHCSMEGLSSSGSIQGAPVDALVTILKHNGINAIMKWVDDFCIFHIPTHSTMNDQNETLKHYSIDLMSVFSVTDPLGMLWHPIWVKGEDFASSVIYVGFLWNL